MSYETESGKRYARALTSDRTLGLVAVGIKRGPPIALQRQYDDLRIQVFNKENPLSFRHCY